MYPTIDLREIYLMVVLEIYYQRYGDLCAKFGAPMRDRQGFADAGSNENPYYLPMIRAMVLRGWPGESVQSNRTTPCH